MNGRTTPILRFAAAEASASVDSAADSAAEAVSSVVASSEEEHPARTKPALKTTEAAPSQVLFTRCMVSPNVTGTNLTSSAA